jgi:hypothetical protein
MNDDFEIPSRWIVDDVEYIPECSMSYDARPDVENRIVEPTEINGIKIKI